MFGYVRPLSAELKVRELEDYKAVYCGLCRAMGKRHGFLARFTLNYDFTFLAMLLADGAEPCFKRCRCPVHPFQKRKMCLALSSLELAADESMILSYQKLRDDVTDHGFFRGLPARLAAFALKGAYKKAAKARPDFDRKVTECLQELHGLEGEHCSSMDRVADTFARLLQAAAPPSGDNVRDRALEQLLYHVGRWIYLVDAWDDLDEDVRTGSYNPLLERFEGNPLEHRDEVRVTLLHSRNLAVSAYSLLRPQRWDGILSNILYLGLGAVEESVFTGRWKKKRNNIGE